MDVKKYLNQLRYINITICTKQEQIERLKSIAYKVTPTLSQTPCKGSDTDKIGSAIEKIDELENQISELIHRLINLQKEIIFYISEIDNPQFQNILELKYINCLTFEEIAEKMDLSSRHIKRLSNFALKELEKVIECHHLCVI